ncbi:MAG: ATP synthase F1 subunit delta [Planctomycetes bacterium]|nr:ATP synthase F1 subunit delta [Planctomycetota bacterium]
MLRHPVAKIYARALLEVGQERNEADDYASELTTLHDDVLSDGDFRVFFESPKIPRHEKDKVLVRALEGKVSEPVLNLLRVLVKRGRQFLFPEIAEAYTTLNDEARGRTHVWITTARPLSATSKDRVVGLLRQKLGKEIIPEERVDEDLLGGMTIRVGDVVVDGSVRSRLNEVRELVAAQRLGSDLIQ